MSRAIDSDGLALHQAYYRLGSLTDINSDWFNQGVFNNVQSTARNISKWPENKDKSPEEIWEATKAYFALGFCGGVFVGICDDHSDTNLHNDTHILQKALELYNRVRYGKPRVSWFEEQRHLFKDLSDCVSRDIPSHLTEI